MSALLETTVTDANGPVCRNVFSSILTGPGIADGTARFVSECLLWVISGHSSSVRVMSALPPKADIRLCRWDVR